MSVECSQGTGPLLSAGLTCGFREMHKDGVRGVRGPLRGERCAARGGSERTMPAGRVGRTPGDRLQLRY